MEWTLEQWSQIGIAAGMLLTALATLVATLWLGRQGLQIAGLLKGQEKAILAQLDQPTDVLPKLIERWLGIPAPVVSAVLTAAAKTVLANLDVPVQEVNVAGSMRP